MLLGFASHTTSKPPTLHGVPGLLMPRSISQSALGGVEWRGSGADECERARKSANGFLAV
jgi:hypothetical protein